eukprot:scaffold249893_cov19-Prasinocladus_malaysianus.AAC.1
MRAWRCRIRYAAEGSIGGSWDDSRLSIKKPHLSGACSAMFLQFHITATTSITAAMDVLSRADVTSPGTAGRLPSAVLRAANRHDCGVNQTRYAEEGLFGGSWDDIH